MATYPELSRVIGIMVGAMLIISASLSAARATARDEGSVHIVVGDLDFSNPHDLSVFRRRVKQAVGDACRRDGQLDFLELSACYRQVSDDIVDKLGNEDRTKLLKASRKTELWWVGKR